MSKINVPVRPRRLRRVTLAVVFVAILVGVGVGWAVDARADGVISDTEAAYILTYHDAVCGTLDSYPTVAGVAGVWQGIIDDGFTDDSAVDIINASVESYCHRHWALLQAIGRAARGEQVA